MKIVAIQGVRGSYSEEAACQLFGTDIRLIECATFTSALEKVTDESAEFAVIPLRNKIIGDIIPAVIALEKAELSKSGRLDLPVRHVLAGTFDSTLDQIQTVISHPAALLQCAQFLKSMPRLSVLQCEDTASGIRDVVERKEETKAAICSERAAALYGANVISRGVADDADNMTTFYVITK